MTLKEKDNFYRNDEYLYKLIYNKEFVDFYNNNEVIKLNFDLFDIQNLINKLIVNKNDFINLYSSLDNKDKLILNGLYIENCLINYNSNNITIGLFLESNWFIKKMVYPVVVNRYNGKVDLCNLYNLNIYNDLSIEELLKVCQSNNKVLDYTDVSDVIKNHNLILKLREYIFKLASIGILYEYNYNIELNYINALIFIKNVNSIFNLNINPDYLKEIYNRDYSKYSNELDRVVYYKKDVKKKRLFK